ncbi:phosphotransferase [Mycoplasmatota bacterium]|nr:phosphotransferase [Mycoplasmatota bacterium]
MIKVVDVLHNWDIKSDSVNQIYTSAWSIGPDYIIKSGKNLESAKRNLTIIKCLNEIGIPVAEIVPTIHGDNLVIVEDKYFILSKRICGRHTKNIYDMNYIDIAQESGDIIAKLHLAFLECQNKIECWENSLLTEMNGWIKDVFDSEGYSLVSKEEFLVTVRRLDEVYSELPKQLIHRDLHFGNLLFEQGKVSGYIDFDLSQKNIRIFDICYFVLGLLIDCINDKEKINKWFIVLKNFIIGYERNISLTDNEKKSASCVMECIEILFLAYFTKNKDYKLAQNAAEMFKWIRKNETMIQESFLLKA